MTAGIGMALLPEWARVAWAAVFAAVVLLHAWHAYRMPGQPRYWHAGHTIMAAGMTAMYLLPEMTHPMLYRVGLVLFGLLTIAMAASGLRLHRLEGVANPLWMATTIDMLAMTYMLVPAGIRPAGLTWGFVMYLAGQAVAWALGVWERVPVLTPIPAAAASDAGGAVFSAGSTPPPKVTITGGPAGHVGLPAHCTLSIRISLAVMAAGMGYMLAIM